jgi:hypothetical protein
MQRLFLEACDCACHVTSLGRLIAAHGRATPQQRCPTLLFSLDVLCHASAQSVCLSSHQCHAPHSAHRAAAHHTHAWIACARQRGSACEIDRLLGTVGIVWLRPCCLSHVRPCADGPSPHRLLLATIDTDAHSYLLLTALWWPCTDWSTKLLLILCMQCVRAVCACCLHRSPSTPLAHSLTGQVRATRARAHTHTHTHIQVRMHTYA